MNKAELIEGLTARLGDKKVATHALEGFIDIVERAVAKGEKVSITGFGSFEKVDRPARTGRNPQTGATVKIKKTSVPKFRPGAALKQVANGTTKKGREPKHEPLLPQNVLRIVASAQSETAAAAPTAKRAASKTTTAKTAAAKTATSKTAASKTTAAKTAATKTAATKTAATKTATSGAAAKKAPATKVTASKTAAKKAPAKSVPAKAAATKATATKAAATKTAAKKAPAKKTTARKAAAK